jgi:HAD superfamily hydrolase (TIGR01459 family)
VADTAEPISGLGELTGRYDVLLCDVFGVLHNEGQVFPAATAALTAFRACGGTVVLVSNAPEPGTRLLGSLAARGVAPAYDSVATAADVTRILLKDQDRRAVLHIGPLRDRCLFEGLAIAFAEPETAEFVVCTGYPETDHNLDLVLAVALRRGLQMLCTNPDTSLVVGDKRLRFAGLVARRYRDIGGVVVETGKPGGLIYGNGIAQAEAMLDRAVDPSRVLGVGDTYALDVLGALAHGFSALHIGTDTPTPPGDRVGRLYRMPALVW